MDTISVLIVTTIFMLAGTVKGVIGLGLPTVSLALLTVAIDLPSAMALLLVPSFVTNAWQACSGGHTSATFLRIWPFLLMAAITVGLGAMALTRVDLSMLSVLLGVLLVSYAAISLCGFSFQIKKNQEIWAGLLTGSVNGVLTGMTGSFVVPGVMYLQSINLQKDALIQAMGMLFTVSTLALGAALGNSEVLNMKQGMFSLAAVIPAIIGMAVGQSIRARLSAQWFRKVFFVSLLTLGLYIIITHL